MTSEAASGVGSEEYPVTFLPLQSTKPSLRLRTSSSVEWCRPLSLNALALSGYLSLPETGQDEPIPPSSGRTPVCICSLSHFVSFRISDGVPTVPRKLTCEVAAALRVGTICDPMTHVLEIAPLFKLRNCLSWPVDFRHNLDSAPIPLACGVLPLSCSLWCDVQLRAK